MAETWDERGSSLGRLARLGLSDPERAAEGLAQVGSDLVEPLAATADPDLALHNLVRLRDALPDPAPLDSALRDGTGLRRRLLAVLGFSAALGEHLVRHPEHWNVLADDVGDEVGSRAALLAAVGADAAGAEPTASSGGESAYDALRVTYRRCLLAFAARDLAGELPVERVSGSLADLAGAALETGLAIARAELAADAVPCRLAVIALGKCGGRELNYVSDVDVVFVAEPADGDEQAALATATTLAAGMMRACSQNTAEGTLWPVDAALRPEGNAGALVRTLASHVAYYKRWAKTWEFQALLKARPVAGDRALGEQYVACVAPLVWGAADRDGFVDAVRAMRRRVEDHVPDAEARRQLKLGRGGLRDVEFAVQLLQLVHGRTDERLRSANTLEALAALTAGGYVGRDDGPPLADAYRFLRALEHRLQLQRLRRTQVLPERDDDLRRLGRALGFRRAPVAELTDEWRRHAREVRRLHEKLFYRPLLSAVARLPTSEVRLAPDAAKQRLEALGYADPAGALRHIEALTAGVSRTAAIQRTLLPVLLGWFADGAMPDHGLLAFRQASEALGRTHWYLRLLRDDGAAAERLAHVLASGKYAAGLLLRAPEAVRMLPDDAQLALPGREALSGEAASLVDRQEDPERAVAALRGLRRRELFRVAAADLLGLVEVDTVGLGLATVAEVTLDAALRAARRSVLAAGEQAPARFAVIAMGRFGGAESGYGSDADVLFVYEPEPGADDAAADRYALRLAEELRRLLGLPGPDPPLAVDADLRPEGRSGPLVRSLASYAAYYERWSSPWESQALLRGRPVAGDADLRAAFTTLADPLRWPAGGPSDDAMLRIRRLKARMEAERLPRGADRATHLKLGPGGLSDVEWAVQLLQLRHAGEVPALRTTGTLAALRAAVDARLLAGDDAEVLTDAWRLASRIRNASVLVTGKSSDALPVQPRVRAAVAQVLGYPPGGTGDLVEDYRRATRHARAVFERVFYED